MGTESETELIVTALYAAPSTKLEHERIGPLADGVKEQSKQAGEEAVEQTEQVAQETASVATKKTVEAVAEIKDTAHASAESDGHELSKADAIDRGRTAG